MRRYETIVIADPDLSEEERTALFSKISDSINENAGQLILLDDWGMKNLAYEIRKKPRGYYARFDFCGTGILITELERILRIDDRVMKYLTVLLEENVDIEKIKEEHSEEQVITEAVEQAEETVEDSNVSEGEAESSDATEEVEKPEEPASETGEPASETENTVSNTEKEG